MRPLEEMELQIADQHAALGVFADSGLPIEAQSLSDLSDASPTLPQSTQILACISLKNSSAKPQLGTVSDVSANDLWQAGWGVIFPRDSKDDAEAQLQPLLDLRRSQSPDELFKVFRGPDGYCKGDTASSWLARAPRNSCLGPVDPFQGVPFYLLLVGSPSEIPFDFQFTLDLFFGVGRLYFDDPSGYRAYADSVVRHESGQQPIRSRSIAYFSPRHDPATDLFNELVVAPLTQGDEHRRPLAEANTFSTIELTGNAATKCALRKILCSESRPSILFTGTHGAAYKPHDPLRKTRQGSLICQDWRGKGPIDAKQMFSGADIPLEADLTGMVHFSFACYSGGWSAAFPSSENGAATGVEDKDSLSMLPLGMLSHGPGAALAVIAHIDLARAYSFASPRGEPQLQGFRDVLIRLMQGKRIGFATDQFNIRWSALYKEMEDFRRLAAYPDLKPANHADELGKLTIGYEDARNYLVLGDPAVQILTGGSPATKDAAHECGGEDPH